MKAKANWFPGSEILIRQKCVWWKLNAFLNMKFKNDENSFRRIIIDIHA